jgi:hemolysin activation/secretion protein
MRFGDCWRAVRVKRAAMLGACAFALLAGFSGFAYGQDAAPGAASPAAPASSPPSASSSGASASANSSAPAEPAKAERKFNIRSYIVEGNTVLDTRAIERAVYPYLGPDRAMSDIEGARAALEKAYAAAGFQTVYVAIPKQTVRDGIVRLKAVEAKIGEVTLKGGRWTSDGEVSEALPSLQPGSVPNLKDVNQELTALNSRSTDLQVTPQMKAGKAPGTIDVDLGVQDKLALHGGVEINNRYSRDTHQYRVQANASYDNLWGMNHSLSGLYNVAPENMADGEVYALTYTAPVPGSDVKLSLTVLRSNSNVTTLGSTDILGKGWSATLGAVMPLGTASLFGDGDYFHYLQASVSYKRFTNVISQTSASTTGSGNTTTSDLAPITYYPFSLGYNGSWHDAKDQVALGLSANFAFRHLGSNQPGFDYSRTSSDGNYFYLKGNVSWLRNLPYGFDLYLAGTGQFSNGALISNEQFSLGGDGSVRGYLQSEGLGDQGIQGTLEIRSPNFDTYFNSGFINDLRLVTFFDGGRAWLESPLKNQQDVYNLGSTGAGATTEMFDHLYGSVYWAYALHGAGASGVTKYGTSRIQFRVWTEF